MAANFLQRRLTFQERLAQLYHAFVYLLLITIILVLCSAVQFLAYDPNYGILTARAGLFLIRHDPRRRAWILIDMDSFKAYNTLHGHSMADRRVRRAWHRGPERRMGERRALRFIVAKRGGDEKLVSCRPGEEELVVALMRARFAAEDITFTACIQSDGRDLDAMLIAAERRILDSKARNEKNTVLYLPVV